MKTILITGAATGIGKETALLFAKNGWNVAATMRNPQKADDLSPERNIRCYTMDVTDKESISSALHSAIKDFGKIDVLVNNAGVYETAPLECTEDEIVNRILQTNLLGTISTIKAILPHFRENKGGKIINIASVAGRVTFPYQTVYHASE